MTRKRLFLKCGEASRKNPVRFPRRFPPHSHSGSVLLITLTPKAQVSPDTRAQRVAVASAEQRRGDLRWGDLDTHF